MRKIPGLVLLLALTLGLTGCLDILSVSQPAQVERGEQFVIAVNFKTTSTIPGSGNPFGAIKVPVGSVLVSAEAGTLGAITRNSAIEAQLSIDHPPGAGYEWWAGYTANSTTSSNQGFVATLTLVGPDVVSNVYSIDYRVGILKQEGITYYDASLGHSLTVGSYWNPYEFDGDGDGVLDTWDHFPLNLAASSDTDDDGYPDDWNASCDTTCQANSGLTLDNCPAIASPTQTDSDGDSQGDVCDDDDDNDGVLDIDDDFSFYPEADTDTDGDGMPDTINWAVLPVIFFDGFEGGSIANPPWINSAGWVAQSGELNSGSYAARTFLTMADPYNYLALNRYVTGSEYITYSARIIPNDGSYVYLTLEGAHSTVTAFDGPSWVKKSFVLTTGNHYLQWVAGLDVGRYNATGGRVYLDDVRIASSDLVEDNNDDNDERPDGYDAFPLDASESVDTDSDGIGNNTDTDDDNDGLPDIWEAQYGLNSLANDAAGDLDGDGIANLDEYINGTDPTVFTSPSNVKNDFDADGDSDLFWRDSASGSNVVWVMQDGTRSAANVLGSNAAAFTVEGIADFDGDGDDDVLFRNNASGQSLVWTLQGGVKAGAIVLGTNATSYSIKGVADFDGDGDADILFRDSSGNNLLWTIQNATKVGAVVLGANASAYAVEATEDFDADGDADILFRNNSTGQSVIWTIQNAAKTGAIVLGTNAAVYAVAGAADFNNDGDSDILFRDAAGNNVVWTIENAAKTGSAVLGANAASYSVAAVADFDGDSDSDILFRNGSGNNVIWAMQDHAKAGVSVLGSNASSYSVAGTADFDGDGDEDILFRNGSTGQNVLWMIQNNAKAAANVLSTNAATMEAKF